MEYSKKRERFCAALPTRPLQLDPFPQHLAAFPSSCSLCPSPPLPLVLSTRSCRPAAPAASAVPRGAAISASFHGIAPPSRHTHNHQRRSYTTGYVRTRHTSSAALLAATNWEELENPSKRGVWLSQSHCLRLYSVLTISVACVLASKICKKN